MPRLGETIPTLAVRDLMAAVAFYAEQLGFVARHQESGFAIVCRDTAEIRRGSRLRLASRIARSKRAGLRLLIVRLPHRPHHSDYRTFAWP